MNEEMKENGSVNEIIEISWRKIFAWIAFVLSVIVPEASIGAVLISLSSVTDEERTEVSVICFVALGISCFMLISEFVSRLLFI